MRHNCNVTTRQVVRYVRHHLGESGVSALLERAGEIRPVEVLEDLTAWSSYDELRRLLEAAGVLLGGPGELRQAGRHIDRTDSNPGLLALFRSLGSPSELLRFIAETAAKFSTVVAMEAVEIGEYHGVVAAHSVEGFPRYPELCEFTAGLLAQSPDMFGCPAATVEETACETRGDPRCLFVVRWSDNADDMARRVAHLEEVVEALTDRFESLSVTVGDLLSGAGIDDVLDGIMRSAAHAIRAPSYMLAVRLDDDTPVLVHHVGFEGETAAFARLLVDPGAPLSSPSCLTADVCSSRRYYGRLAAINRDGVSFLPDEGSVLAAYAKLAAAALDAAAALEAARSQAALAHTLLDLANHLANATGRDETAQRLANAVPDVIGCDVASVLTYDPSRQVMTFTAFHGFSDDLVRTLDGLEVAATDTPWFGEIVRNPRPLFFDTETGGDDPYVRAMLDLIGISGTVIVPILGAGTLYGVVTAGVRTGTVSPAPRLLHRLAGLADQAAVAFRNAELVDMIRDQALHDPLTGTPNRRLLEDRVEVALAAAGRTGTRAALLFVDLDGFKQVNDEFGHDVGDDVLCAVAERLTGTIRGSDTVARLGGDEFAVLLPGVRSTAEAEIVAEKLEDALAAPFTIGATEVALTASIGVAMSASDGETWRSLLRRADGAMYLRKSCLKTSAG